MRSSDRRFCRYDSSPTAHATQPRERETSSTLWSPRFGESLQVKCIRGRTQFFMPAVFPGLTITPESFPTEPRSPRKKKKLLVPLSSCRSHVIWCTTNFHILQHSMKARVSLVGRLSVSRAFHEHNNANVRSGPRQHMPMAVPTSRHFKSCVSRL